MSEPMDAGTLRRRIGGRPLYLWGAAQVGIGMLHSLERSGIEVRAFIDKRAALHGTELHGKPVMGPGEVLEGFLGARPFIIHTTFQYQEAIAAQCQAAGLEEGRDFLSYAQINPLDYQVVVAGICNLKCISCPLGNMPLHRAGLMSAQTYGQVLDKILAENPMLGVIQLYNWGEPLLNPDLAEIIRRTGERGVLCAVSSNLAIKKDFEEVIAAKPGIFRISLSGTGGSYGITHTGGDWERVQHNMRALARHRGQHHPQMPVEVTYHLYRDNGGEPRREVQALCEELGFVFRPHLAALLPLDNVAAYTLGRTLSEEAERTVQMLALPMEEALAEAASRRQLDCAMEHAINIEWDTSVKHCGLYYDARDNRVTDSYLETPLDEILRRREASTLCRRCKGPGLHRFCAVYTDRTLSPEDRREAP